MTRKPKPPGHAGVSRHRKARYRIGGTCQCEQPKPLQGAGPYGTTICAHCGRLTIPTTSGKP
jgi:hypothetical protein